MCSWKHEPGVGVSAARLVVAASTIHVDGKWVRVKRAAGMYSPLVPGPTTGLTVIGVISGGG